MRRAFGILLSSAIGLTLAGFIGMAAPAMANTCVNGSGVSCYHIYTTHGNSTFFAEDSDSVGSYLVSRTSEANARAYYFEQTNSSCPGVSNCTQNHILSAQNYRLVSVFCDGNNNPSIQLATNTDQTGDTWYYWTDSDGEHYIISRYCSTAPNDLNAAAASDEMSGDYWNLNDLTNWYRSIQLILINTP